MNVYLYLYLAAWSLACVGALVIFARSGRRQVLLSPAYRQFLLRPWKVATFSLSCAGITLIAPYTGDPTWDYFDAFFMSVLAFWTAPWAVGVLYLFCRRRAGWQELYLAICTWMFSASWSYDLYLLLRDGRYPVTWAANIGASSVLYASAGLLWNLSAPTGRGVIFAFMEADWPQARNGQEQTGKIAWFAVPFMILAAVLVLSFVW